MSFIYFLKAFSFFSFPLLQYSCLSSPSVCVCSPLHHRLHRSCCHRTTSGRHHSRLVIVHHCHKCPCSSLSDFMCIHGGGLGIHIRHTNWQSVWLIRIGDPYKAYGFRLPNLPQSLQQMHKRIGEKLTAAKGKDEYDGFGGHWRHDRRYERRRHGEKEKQRRKKTEALRTDEMRKREDEFFKF